MTKEEHHKAIDAIMAKARALKLQADRELAELDRKEAKRRELRRWRL